MNTQKRKQGKQSQTARRAKRKGNTAGQIVFALHDHIKKLESLNQTYQSDIANLLQYIANLKTQVAQLQDANEQLEEQRIRESQSRKRMSEFVQFVARARPNKIILKWLEAFDQSQRTATADAAKNATSKPIAKSVKPKQSKKARSR